MKRRSNPARRGHPSSQLSAVPHRNGLRVVFTERQIQKRVRELAGQINRDYEAKAVHVIGILENCFMFMADLLRALRIPVVCHFMKVETRDRLLGTVDLRELMYTPKVEVAGKDVLLVTGILHSGIVQDHLHRYLLGQKPASLRTATLVEKRDQQKVEVKTEYTGFKSSAKFLVGYGLGYEDKYRNLPHIAALAWAEPGKTGEGFKASNVRR